MGIKVFFILSFCLFSSYSFSAMVCEGKVTKVAVHYTGEVRLRTDYRTDYHAICRLDGKLNNISADVCKAWLGEVQISYVTGKNIEVFYPNGTSCSSFPSGSNAPKPSWLILS